MQTTSRYVWCLSLLCWSQQLGTGGKWAKAHSMSDGKIILDWLDHQFLSTHSKLLIFIPAVKMLQSHPVSIDLGGAYTCQDDIIKLMNIAFLHDCSKYNPLFEKVKEDTSKDIISLVLCKFANTNSIKLSLNSMCNKTCQCKWALLVPDSLLYVRWRYQLT